MLAAALLLSLIAASAPDTTPDLYERLMAPGVSRELAEWRAGRVSDVRYALHLNITPRDSAIGTVTVSFTQRDRDDAILDFRGSHLTSVTVGNADITDRVEWNGAHIRVPGAVFGDADGRRSITVGFVSDIRPAGTSIIRYTDSDDGEDYFYTLLVPSDANLLFPAFDQPDLKARLTLSLDILRPWTAVSNGAEVRRVESGELSTVHFAESRPISTYLMAFAAGPWEKVTSPRDMRPMAMYVRRSRAAEVDADTLFALNARALDWLERWFNSPYPFDKYDFVLAPAFPFGGMEHPGAVFYSEERFVFRERPTVPQVIGRAATIYHEVAHMWFGNLVTMRWFDDLWLKEGFATYMAAKVQAALDPETQPWQSFWLRNKPAAYNVDASSGTVPVWQELANLDQAKSNYGAIVYNKAPGILRQLDYLVGERDFQRGVQRFLQSHAYGNANWQDLLGAIGTASGQSLGDWGEHYILRPGMPLLEPSMVVSPGGSRITILQRPAREQVSGAEPWPVRLEVAVGNHDGTASFQQVDMEGAAVTVPVPAGTRAPAFAFANANDRAYALTMLDERTLAWLTDGGLPRVEDSFLRAMLWGALWDEVRQARLAPGAYASLVIRYLPREDDEQLISSSLSRLTRAATAYMHEGDRAAIEPALRSFLASGISDSSLDYGVRRAYLRAHIRTASSPAALASLDSLLDLTMVAGDTLRDPTRWEIVTRLVEAAAPGADDRLLARMRADTTSDGRRRAFVAGAARREIDSKRSYFDRYLTDSTLNEDWVTASLDAFNAVEHQFITGAYLTRALDALPFIQENRRIFFLGAWLGSFMGGQSSRESLDTVNDWLAGRPDLPPDLRQKVLQAVDELERTVRIRERFAVQAEE